MEEKSVTLSVHGNICRRNTLVLKFSAVKPAVWIAHRIAVKDEPISVIHGESHQVPSPPFAPWRLHLLFHALSGCVLALLHAFLQPLLVSIVDRIHQRSPCLGGDGICLALVIMFKVFRKGFVDLHSSSFPGPLSRSRRSNQRKKEGAAFPHPEKRPLGVFSTCWLGRTESCQLLHIHFKALLHRCLHRLIVLPMQQAVGCKRGIVILDDLVSIGEEIDMRQEQFCRVVIHPFSELRPHRGCEAVPHELIQLQYTCFDPFLQTGAFTQAARMLADIVLAVFARHIFGRVMKWAAVYPTASGFLTGLRHHQLLQRLQRRVSHEIVTA